MVRSARFAVVFASFVSLRAEAQECVDFGVEQWQAGGNLGLAPRAQSFVASCSDLRTFSIYLSPSGGTGSAAVTLRVREGAGLSGAILGEVTEVPTVAPEGFHEFYVGAVDLVPGQTYTVEIVGAGDHWMIYENQHDFHGADYPDGDAWVNGSVQTIKDLAFRATFGAAPAVAAYSVAGEVFAAEDIATPASDADFNDVALYYSRRCTFGARGDLARETIDLRALSAGAAETNTVFLDLPGTPRVATLTREGQPSVTPAIDGNRVTLFEDFRQAFDSPTGTFVNTDGGPVVDGPWWRLEVEYVEGQVVAPQCSKAAIGIARPADGVVIDATTTLPGTNLPLAGSFPGSFKVPSEGRDIVVAYPQVALWLQGQAGHEDWYLSPDPDHVVDRGVLASTLPLPALPTCDDFEQNAEEEGIDCGGVCPACITCDDGLQNGDEEGVDCGGSACSPCATPRLVFVTSTQHTGDFAYYGSDGVSGADWICQERANLAGHSGTFLAWISTTYGSDAPNFRFDTSGGPFVRWDGTVVAADWWELTSGQLQAPIALDEFGFDWSDYDMRPYVWTHVGFSGDADSSPYDCGGWYDWSDRGGVGDYTATSGNWTDGPWRYCDEPYRLYCFQQNDGGGGGGGAPDEIP